MDQSRDITLPTKVCLVKVTGFSSSHVWMWELDHREGWAPKNWCFWTVVLEKTLESPLDCKIKSIHPKVDQSWIFIGRTDAEAEAPILWPLDANNWLIGKDPDAGKGWRWEVKGSTEDEMFGWHQQLNGHELEQAPGVGDGQGSLAYCSPWGCQDWTRLNDRTDWDIENDCEKQQSWDSQSSALVLKTRTTISQQNGKQKQGNRSKLRGRWMC